MLSGHDADQRLQWWWRRSLTGPLPSPPNYLVIGVLGLLGLRLERQSVFFGHSHLQCRRSFWGANLGKRAMVPTLGLRDRREGLPLSSWTWQHIRGRCKEGTPRCCLPSCVTSPIIRKCQVGAVGLCTKGGLLKIGSFSGSEIAILSPFPNREPTSLPSMMGHASLSASNQTLPSSPSPKMGYQFVWIQRRPIWSLEQWDVPSDMARSMRAVPW